MLLFVVLLLSAEAGRLAAQSHASRESNSEMVDAMRRTVSLLVPMTALVLGLLISNGKAAFDAQAASVSRIASSASLLDELLRHYGQEAMPARVQLRKATKLVVTILWEKAERTSNTVGPGRAGNESFIDAVTLLKPKDEREATIKVSAVAAANSLVQERFYLATLEHSSFPIPVAAVIYLWLAIIFAVHGFGSPARHAVRVVEGAVAVSASLALWLVFELDRPFDGLVQISRQSMHVLSAALR